jgi:hypothetical protein
MKATERVISLTDEEMQEIIENDENVRQRKS